MNLTKTELGLIMEAIDARLETGDFTVNEDVSGDIEVCSPSHKKSLHILRVRIADAWEHAQGVRTVKLEK